VSPDGTSTRTAAAFLTGRTQEEIAMELPSLRGAHGVDPSSIRGAQPAPMPGFMAPMSAFSAAGPPGNGLAL